MGLNSPFLRWSTAAAALALSNTLASGAVAQQQVNDPDFNPQVDHPAFTKKHPRIGIDESH